MDSRRVAGFTFFVLNKGEQFTIELKRRSVQSYVEIGLLPLEDSDSSIAANHTFHRWAPRGM